jgi:hypothetical protein
MGQAPILTGAALQDPTAELSLVAKQIRGQQPTAVQVISEGFRIGCGHISIHFSCGILSVVL